MEKKIKKFLEFNGKSITFLAINGVYWVAIKPICEALGVNYNRQWQNIKEEKILGGAYAKQHMHDASGRLQPMVSLPEFYVYGWIFSIQSESEDLQEYKWKCYELLYNYFHGTITERQSILKQKTILDMKIDAQRLKMESNQDFKDLQKLLDEKKKVSSNLAKSDKNVISSQYPIWEQEFTGKQKTGKEGEDEQA